MWEYFLHPFLSPCFTEAQESAHQHVSAFYLRLFCPTNITKQKFTMMNREKQHPHLNLTLLLTAKLLHNVHVKTSVYATTQTSEEGSLGLWYAITGNRWLDKVFPSALSGKLHDATTNYANLSIISPLGWIVNFRNEVLMFGGINDMIIR